MSVGVAHSCRMVWLHACRAVNSEVPLLDNRVDIYVQRYPPLRYCTPFFLDEDMCYCRKLRKQTTFCLFTKKEDDHFNAKIHDQFSSVVKSPVLKEPVDFVESG